MRKILIFISLFPLIAAHAGNEPDTNTASRVIRTSQTVNQINAGKFISLFTDSTNTMTAAGMAVSDRFVYGSSNVINAGISEAHVWARLVVENDSDMATV